MIAARRIAARRPDAHTALGRAFARYGKQVEQGWSVAWASGTFDGARHRFTLRCGRPQADRLAADLGELEVPMPGHFLASAEVAIRIDEGAASTLVIEALTLAEG